jgi:hypothetical protein
MQQQVIQTNVVSKSTPRAGTGLFAARQIKLNEVILSVNQPLMLALDTARLNDTCYCCLLFREKPGSIKRIDKAETKTLKACTGCKIVRYCDKVRFIPGPSFRDRVWLHVVSRIAHHGGGGVGGSPRLLPNKVASWGSSDHRRPT